MISEVEDLTIATIIAQQMGGVNRLVKFVGAHSFVGSANSLTFKFKAEAKDNIKCVKVVYEEGPDTYKMEFFSQKGSPTFEVKLVKEHSNVYCDDLIRLFEKTTGLYLSL